jgi:hypothetical protein
MMLHQAESRTCLIIWCVNLPTTALSITLIASSCPASDSQPPPAPLELGLGDCVNIASKEANQRVDIDIRRK